MKKLMEVKAPENIAEWVSRCLLQDKFSSRIDNSNRAI